jgi:hypothetical protein
MHSNDRDGETHRTSPALISSIVMLTPASRTTSRVNIIIIIIIIIIVVINIVCSIAGGARHGIWQVRLRCLCCDDARSLM